MSTLAIGVFLPTMAGPSQVPGDVVAAARHSEQLGFESAWVVDQLIAGTGVPFLESTVALSAAAAVTTRIQLGFGVLILPLRPVTWVAKQVGSLQHLSGDRVLLGIGVGGDRHDRSWSAAGVPRNERGGRTDVALRVLPDLVAGKPVHLPGGGDAVQLAPAATVPPIIVGGMAEAAIRRAVDCGDGWFLLPMSPSLLGEAGERLAEVAAGRGRPIPAITAGMLVAISGDRAAPDRDSLIRRLTDPDGMYGMPAEQVSTLLTTGDAPAIAERLSEYASHGAARVVVTLAAGDWYRQAELLAQARALLG